MTIINRKSPGVYHYTTAYRYDALDRLVEMEDAIA